MKWRFLVWGVAYFPLFIYLRNYEATHCDI